MPRHQRHRTQTCFENKWEMPVAMWSITSTTELSSCPCTRWHLVRGESRDHTGPGGLTSTHWHIKGFLLSLKNPNCSLFFKSGIQEFWKELWIDIDVVCPSGAYVVVVEISADQLALQQTCGVPSKGEGRCVSQTVFKTCLHHCWRDAEVVPHNVTLQQEKPQPTQSQTTREVM